MEFLKELVVDWLLFSLVEGFIFCKFFETVGNLRKFLWYEVVVVSLLLALISSLFPMLFSQIIFIEFLILYLKTTKRANNINQTLKLLLLACFFIIISEMLIYFIYLLVFNIDYDLLCSYLTFLCLIPTRCLQILILYK